MVLIGISLLWMVTYLHYCCCCGYLVTKLCPTLSMEFPRQEYWSKLPFPSLGGAGLPNPGIKPMSPALAGRFFTTESTGSSVQLFSHIWLFETSWTAASQASLSITYSQSLLKLMSIESVMLSNHLILSSPSPDFNLSQHQGLFQWVISLHQVAKILELQHQCFQWIFRTNFL